MHVQFFRSPHQLLRSFARIYETVFLYSNAVKSPPSPKRKIEMAQKCYHEDCANNCSSFSKFSESKPPKRSAITGKTVQRDANKAIETDKRKEHRQSTSKNANVGLFTQLFWNPGAKRRFTMKTAWPMSAHKKVVAPQAGLFCQRPSHHNAQQFHWGEIFCNFAKNRVWPKNRILHWKVQRTPDFDVISSHQ